MADVVSSDPDISAPTQLVLTPEQRDRIAKQKAIALAIRSAKEPRNGTQLPSFASPGEADCVVSGPSAVFREGASSTQAFVASGKQDFRQVSHGLLGKRGIQLGKPSFVIGSNKKIKGLSGQPLEVIEVKEDTDDEINASRFENKCDQKSEFLDSKVKTRIVGPSTNISSVFKAGWRSVRKRPSPGHSFGREVSFDDITNSSEFQPSSKGFRHPRTNVDDTKDTGSKGESTAQGSGRSGTKGGRIFSLSEQQVKVLKAIARGKSVFITGSAGTGKSYLLDFAVRVLRTKYDSSSVFVTASTGLAACALGGTTLHSFSGIGLGVESKEVLLDKVKSKRDVKKRLMEANALIIDEISMIDGELFDKLEFVTRVVRGPAGKDKMFGGVQLIVTGDFFQLPPVHPENPEKYFAFEAECWNKCFDLQIELTQVFRQSDSEFVGMLNELRKGYCLPPTLAKLEGCIRPVNDPDTGIVLTKLYPRKMDVGRENEQNLRSLNKETVEFLAKDDGRSEFAKRQLENLRAEKVLYLSIGAQVMLVKNLETSVGLVNGARGVVVRFTPVDDVNAKEFSHLASFISPSGVWPVVRFACDDVERIVGPESWSIKEGSQEVAKRSQVPLILAWALSVHKCQGMTLDRVETDLSRSFEYGMVYVALSRVKCLDGLRLVGFDPSRIKVHPKVVQFYEELKTGEI